MAKMPETITVDVRLDPRVESLGGARCSQCGQSWGVAACGPTHALIAHRRMNEPVFALREELTADTGPVA